MKKTKKSKFDLEKFEIAKLRNLKSIKGGDGDDTKNHTIDLTILLGTRSTKDCME